MAKTGAVINKASGTLAPEQAEKRLKDIKDELKPIVSPGFLSVLPGDQVRQEIQRFIEKGIEVLIIGGGDGTISTAAKLVSGTGITLVALGLGTRNHFTRDLGMPEDPIVTIRLIEHMPVKQIDLGEVNGHGFINNATLGLYPEIVELREETMQKHGWKKWSAHVAAAFKVLWWLPQMRLSVKIDQQRRYQRTPFLFVGNNEYKGIAVTDSGRLSLDAGKLWFCMPKTSNLWLLLKLVWQLNLHGFKKAENLETHLLQSVTVYSRRSHIKIALDGENFKLATPLQFKIKPKVLRVAVP